MVLSMSYQCFYQFCPSSTCRSPGLPAKRPFRWIKGIDWPKASVKTGAVVVFSQALGLLQPLCIGPGQELEPEQK